MLILYHFLNPQDLEQQHIEDRYIDEEKRSESVIINVQKQNIFFSRRLLKEPEKKTMYSSQIPRDRYKANMN